MAGTEGIAFGLDLRGRGWGSGLRLVGKRRVFITEVANTRAYRLFINLLLAEPYGRMILRMLFLPSLKQPFFAPLTSISVNLVTLSSSKHCTLTHNFTSYRVLGFLFFVKVFPVFLGHIMSNFQSPVGTGI